MDLFAFMFSSPYDQASLAVMVVGLLINGAIDLARARGGDRTAPLEPRR